MPNAEAVKYTEESYPERAQRWLDKLKPHVGVVLTSDQVKDLHAVLDRANTVSCAAAGEDFAINRLVIDGPDAIHQLEGNHWGAQLIAASLVGCLEDGGGENYIEVNFNGHPKGPLRVLVQFKHKKTPADVAAERRAKIEELEEQLTDKDAEIKYLQSAVDNLLDALGK